MALDPEIHEYLARMAALAPEPIWVKEPAATRRELDEAMIDMPRMAVRSVEDLSITGPGGQLSLRVYQPTFARPERGLVVFVHGGGFVIGGLDVHDPACRRLCEGAGVPVISVDYRLAPEAQFPAAADDAIRACEWALAHAAELGADPTKVVIMGDSAGGNLAAVAANALSSAQPRPAGQILVYPVTDLRDVTGYESRTYAAEGYGLTQRAMEWFCQCYSPEPWQREDPRGSPILAQDLSAAPPALVLTVEYDPLTSEAEAYARRLAHAGVAVELHRQAGAIHGVLTNGEGWASGDELWSRVFAWLDEVFTG